MTVIDLKVHYEQSPFTFDVWRCPECGYVFTLEQRRTSTPDLRCGGCQTKTISEFELWPGKASLAGGMNFITEE
jgi:rubrerythrin